MGEAPERGASSSYKRQEHHVGITAVQMGLIRPYSCAWTGWIILHCGLIGLINITDGLDGLDGLLTTLIGTLRKEQGSQLVRRLDTCGAGMVVRLGRRKWRLSNEVS